MSETETKYTKYVRKLTVCVNPDINQSYLDSLGGDGTTVDDVWAEGNADATQIQKTAQKFAMRFGGMMSFKATEVDANDTNGTNVITEIYKATLTAVRYDKKMFAPGEVSLVFNATRESSPAGQQMAFSKVAKKVFFGGNFFLEVFGVKTGVDPSSVVSGTDTVGIASNYYIHSLGVESSGSTSYILTLKCFSFDKRLTTARFSGSHTGKTFTSLCKPVINSLLSAFQDDLKTISPDSYDLFDFPEYREVVVQEKREKQFCGDNRLFMMAYDGKSGRAASNTVELMHPYLVQYNESFYDFMVRVAHRCGEFLYFENGRLKLGLPTDVCGTVSSSIENRDEAFKVVARPMTMPLCIYRDISPDSGDVNVEGFHQDYATGVPPVGGIVSEENYYYDIQNTADEDLHYLTEDDNDADRKSPRGTWLLVNFLSNIFLNDKVLNGIGSAMAYLSYDMLCQRVIIPDMTRREFFSNYLSGGDDNTENRLPMVDADGNLTGEYAVERHKETGSSYLRIDTSGNEHPCDEKWFNAELMKSDAAGYYYEEPRRDFSNQRISSNVGIAIDSDDTANLCNKFFHFIETEEEESERKSVTMNFSSNLEDISLARLVRLDDGIEDIYLVTRMYGSYETAKGSEGENITVIGNYAEGVPVLEKPFEGMKRIVVPARGNIPHSRQVSAMEAVVVKNEDPLRLGRVRVRYPWQSESDVNISPWIRITVPFSGTPDYGGFTMTPEVGEHVMLSYVAGNVERPYVEGSLYFREKLKAETNEKSDWRVNAPLTGGAEASKIPYRQIARTDYYRTSYKVRSILSGNGHGVIMSDLSDCNFFTSGIPFLKALVTLGNVVAGNGALHDANLFGVGVIKGGGVTITDGSYMCTVDLLPDKRAINITSSFGTVSIDAFTGISINAPNGDISIKGKNISLEAGNNIQIISGRNISPKRVAGPIGKAAGLMLGDLVMRTGMGMARRGGVDMTDLCDVSFLRAVYEMFVTPVEGTLTLKSNRNVVVTAGRGKVEVPIDTMSHARTYGGSHFDDDERIRRGKRFDFKALKDDIETACNVVESFAEKWHCMYSEFNAHIFDPLKFFGVRRDELKVAALRKYGARDDMYNAIAQGEGFCSYDDFFEDHAGFKPERYDGCKKKYEELQRQYRGLNHHYGCRELSELIDEKLVRNVDQTRIEYRREAIGKFSSLEFLAPLCRIKSSGELIAADLHREFKDAGEDKEIIELSQDYVEYKGLGDCKFAYDVEVCWLQNFKKIKKREIAVAFICSSQNGNDIKLLEVNKKGKVNKTKIDTLAEFKHLRYAADDEEEWGKFVRRIVVDKMDNAGVMFGKGIASAVSSSIKIGRYDDNGKYHCTWFELFNKNGQAGPRAFKGGSVRGNVFISHEPGSFSWLNDDDQWNHTFNHRELEVLTDYLKKL